MHAKVPAKITFHTKALPIRSVVHVKAVGVRGRFVASRTVRVYHKYVDSFSPYILVHIVGPLASTVLMLVDCICLLHHFVPSVLVSTLSVDIFEILGLSFIILFHIAR